MQSDTNSSKASLAFDEQQSNNQSINISVNNSILSVTRSCTFLDLLSKLQIKDTRGLAIARNGEVIASNLWSSAHFESNDSIIIITATQGG